MTVYEHLISLPGRDGFQTREGKLVGKASNSEIRRWFERNAIWVNGKPAKATDETPETWISLVLFPKTRPVTLW
jgi:hypothetical protein